MQPRPRAIPGGKTDLKSKLKPSIDVAGWLCKANKLAKEFRELDNQIQAASWTIEISEQDLTIK